MNLDPDVQTIVLTGAGVVGAILAVRRKFSSDSKEISKDAAERGLMTVLRQERDNAMKDANAAWARSNADAARIATLEAKNEFLTEQVAFLREQAQVLEADQRRLRKQFNESGIGDLR